MFGDVCSDRRATPFAGSLRARMPRSGLTCSTTSLHSKRGRAQIPPQSRSPHAGSIGLGFVAQRRDAVLVSLVGISADECCPMTADVSTAPCTERREGRDVLRCNPKVSPACAPEPRALGARGS